MSDKWQAMWSKLHSGVTGGGGNTEHRTQNTERRRQNLEVRAGMQDPTVKKQADRIILLSILFTLKNSWQLEA